MGSSNNSRSLTRAEIPDGFIPRFWAKVNVVNDDESCWLWVASRTSAGYGQFGVPSETSSRGQRHVTAHKVSYVLHHGDIPAGLVVRHTCDTPLCVRPDHLVIGTQADNMRDLIERHPARQKVAELRRRWNDGACAEDLEQSSGYGHLWILAILKNEAWPDPTWEPRRSVDEAFRKKPCKLTAAEVKAALRQYNNGVSVYRLAERYHVAYSTMWEALKGSTAQRFAAGTVEPDRPRKSPSRSLRQRERHPQAKLTAAKVRTARAEHEDGASVASLARRYGVSTTAMWSAVHGKTWVSVGSRKTAREEDECAQSA